MWGWCLVVIWEFSPLTSLFAGPSSKHLGDLFNGGRSQGCHGYLSTCLRLPPISLHRHLPQRSSIGNEFNQELKVFDDDIRGCLSSNRSYVRTNQNVCIIKIIIIINIYDIYEGKKMGFATWSEAVTAARDRAGWRRQVNGPSLPEET